MDDRLEGKAKQAEGKAQEGWGDLKDKAGDAWDEAKDKADDAWEETKDKLDELGDRDDRVEREEKAAERPL